MVKILIVDDSMFMRRILINILNKAGFNDIIEAENGKEAIQKFKREKPDLVLLDIVMKDEYGTDVLKDIMKIDPNAKVVMISSVGQEAIIKETLESGASDFIVKPFKEEQIISVIKKVLK